jgi:hypothetical protein
MNQTQVLSAMIEGLYRDKANSTLPAGLGLAPAYGSPSMRAEFLVMLTDNRFDDRKDYGKAGSLSQDFQRANTELAPIPVQLNDHKSGFRVIPEDLLASLQDNASVVTAIMDAAADEIYGGFTRELAAVIAAGGLVTGSALNLSTGSADLVDAINDTIRSLQLAGGHSPNTIYMGRATFDAIMNQDQVQQGSAISGYTSAGSAVRRLGSTTPDFVYSFFKSRFGLDLVVDDRVYVNTSGAAAYAAGNNIVLAHSAPGASPSAFKTFHLNTYGGANLLKYINQPAMFPMTPGQAVAAQSVYKVQLVDGNLAASMAITL